MQLNEPRKEKINENAEFMAVFDNISCQQSRKAKFLAADEACKAFILTYCRLLLFLKGETLIALSELKAV